MLAEDLTFRFDFPPQYVFQFLTSIFFNGAQVLSILAVAYSVLAVLLFTFAQGLFILSDVLFSFTYVLSILSKAYFD